MSDKLSETYNRVLEQLRDAEDRVKTLQIQRATLEMAGAHLNGDSPVGPSPSAPVGPNALKTQGNAGLRAPQGELGKRIVAVLKSSGKPASKREIMDALKAQGYRWSLDPFHVSKQLTKMKKERVVKAEGPENARKYYLP